MLFCFKLVALVLRIGNEIIREKNEPNVENNRETKCVSGGIAHPKSNVRIKSNVKNAKTSATESKKEGNIGTKAVAKAAITCKNPAGLID